MDNARMFWVPSISPSSLMFYTGERFPQWRGNMFVGALNGLSLQRVAFGQPSQAERREPVLRTAEPAHPRRAAGARRLHLRRDGAAASAAAEADGTILRLEPLEGS